MDADTTPPPVPPELAPAFNELAARADAAQRLALLALEMLSQELRRQGRPWDLVAAADAMDAAAIDADAVGSRGRAIAAGYLRVLADVQSTGKRLDPGS